MMSETIKIPPKLDPAGRARLAKAIIAATNAEAERALKLHNRGRAQEVWEFVSKTTQGLAEDEWKALHTLAQERIKALKPRVNWPVVLAIGSIGLIVILLLGGALAISSECRGTDPASFCGRVPEAVVVAIVGPSAIPTFTPTATSTPEPTLTPTQTPTPTPTPTPTTLAAIPPSSCAVGFSGEDGSFQVLAEQPVDYQPVAGDPYRFEAIWQLRPVGSKLCPDMEMYGYQLRPLSESPLPFQREGNEFRLTKLAEDLYEARVPFVVLDPRREASGQDDFGLYYLNVPEHPELVESYREVPLLALQVEWHLWPEVTPTPTPTPVPTRTPRRPTSTPGYTPPPGGSSVPAPVLKSPNEGYSVQEWVTFEWDWGGSLAADLYFQVLVRRENNPKAEFHGVASPTKKKAIEVNFSELVGNASWNRWVADPDYHKIESGDHLWWSVVMVRWNGKAESPVVMLSETESALRKFVYAGESPVPTSTKPTGSTEEPSPCKCQRLDCRECNCDDACCKQCCPKCNE